VFAVITAGGRPFAPETHRLVQALLEFREIQCPGLVREDRLILDRRRQLLAGAQPGLRPEPALNLLERHRAADRDGVAPAVREPRVLGGQLDVGDDRPVVEPRVAVEHDVRTAAGALEDADDLLARAYFARLLGPRVGV